MLSARQTLDSYAPDVCADPGELILCSMLQIDAEIISDQTMDNSRR